MATSPQTILITGGTGFIASYLTMRLLENDPHARSIKEVVLFDRDPDIRRLKGFNKGPSDINDPKYDSTDRYNKIRGRIRFVQGDLSLLPHVLSVFDVHEPTTVFHLGALLSAGAESNPTMGFQVDLLGSWNVLEAARLYYHSKCDRFTTPPIRVVFASTIASFGSFIAAGQKVKNEDVQMPTTMYGISKVSVERLGEYYSAAARNWVDFRAVRFPSVIGASRGPGGTTVYSTLLVQNPAQGKSYEVYVGPDTRLDIVYVEDAVSALLQLHDAAPENLKRRVYNIAGIRTPDGQAPQASDIEAAVKRQIPAAQITYKVNQQLSDIVHTFGILDDTVAREDWQWPGAAFDLDRAIKDFIDQVNTYPDRIKAIELFG